MRRRDSTGWRALSGRRTCPEGRMAGGAAVAAGPQGSTDGRRAGDAGERFDPARRRPRRGPATGRRPRVPRGPPGIAGVAAQRRQRRRERAAWRARMRSPGEQAVSDIDAALRELRRDEPAIDTVEKGLKAAKAAGVPVDLEGPKPPASALAVTTTGFGPGSVPAKKPVPPPKPVPAVSPLGKAGAKPAKPAGAGKGAAAPARRPAARRRRRGRARRSAPAPLAGDQLLPAAGRRRPASARRTTRRSPRSRARSRASPRPRRRTRRPRRRPRRRRTRRSPRPTTSPGRPRRPRSTRWTPSRPGTFDKKAFIAAVKAAIEAKSPKTLKEADDYKESGKAGEVKGEVKGLVTPGQGGAGQGHRGGHRGAAGPVQGGRRSRSRRWRQEQPGQAGADPGRGRRAQAGAGRAAQPRRRQARGQPGDGATPRSPSSSWRSRTSREFQQALADKQAAAAHADTAPGGVPPAGAGGHRSRARPTPRRRPPPGVAGMQGAKGAALAKLVADKGKTKSKDEAKRAEVTAKIQGIFAATEADVKKILDGIDPKVDAAFERGRGGGAGGVRDLRRGQDVAPTRRTATAAGWAGCAGPRTSCSGCPTKVNEFYEAGRELYLKQMDGVISRVADIVGADLTAAKQRIATGRAEIATYVKSLPADLQKVGSEASKEIGDKFEQLESDVDAKQEAVVDTLATKYVEARKGLDERIEALQAENKGLVDKAIGAIKAVINTIRELAAMLKNVLARVAGVVGDIIKNPVGVPRQPDRRREGRHPQVQGQHPRPPPQGPDGLAVRRARRGRRRAARHVRPQGHHQAARVDLRPDLGQHPQPARQADRREGDGRRREGRRDLPDHRHRGRRRPVADARSRSSATSRR